MVLTDLSCRTNALRRLLLQGWPGARQARVPGPEDEPSVSDPAAANIFSGRALTYCATSSVATFQTYYQNLWRSIQSGTIFQAPANLLQSVRSLSTAQLATGGVILAECLGFFTVGEMIGRLKLVGYHGETAHH